MPIRRTLNNYLILMLLPLIMVASVTAQTVTFSFEELELDGGNINTDGIQEIGHCVAGTAAGLPVKPVAGVDWLLNSNSVVITAPGLLGNRNLPSGTATLGTPAEGVFFGWEDFREGVAKAGQTPYDAHFAPGVTPGDMGLLPEDQSDLHLVMQGILFGSLYSITINDLTPDTDYRVQIISWDAGVEFEGFGSPGINQKEFRRSQIASGNQSIEYNQFVVDGDDVDEFVGTSSDEITACLITAEFSTDGGETSIVFDFNVPELGGPNENDNCIYNALTVHSVGGFVLGDVNCDGVVDLLDVAPFVDLIVSGGFSVKADINADGVVDLLDVAPFVDLLLGG